MNYRRLYIKNTKIFITAVTSKRRQILIKNIEILRNAFKQAKVKIKFDIDAIVILPEHFHVIISPENIKEYPEIIRKLKSSFSREININDIEDYALSKSRKNKKEKDIWQRRYWEHTIQNENELNKLIDYIHYNPVKHGYVKMAKEWHYSSFLKYVKQGFYGPNWCDFTEDKNLGNTVYE